MTFDMTRARLSLIFTLTGLLDEPNGFFQEHIPIQFTALKNTSRAMVMYPASMINRSHKMDPPKGNGNIP